MLRATRFLLLVAPILLTPAARDDAQISLSRLVIDLGAYVSRFEREFSSAVAEERYVQLVRPVSDHAVVPFDQPALEWYDGRGEYPRKGEIIERRQLLSDLLLVQAREAWVGYRDVGEVDGVAVQGRRERVAKLFLSTGADRGDQLARIAEESARYNLGRFRRTLNIPTLALSFLHARHHFRYTFFDPVREDLDGRTTVVVRFQEHARPTLIGTPSGEDAPIAGRVWIDVGSRAVVQTEIGAVIGGRRASLVTRYRSEPQFRVLVPDYMWEWYDAPEFRFTTVEGVPILECLARYTNYRRFGVTTEQKIR